MEPNPASQTQDAACERCGSFEAMEFAGKILCADCIQLAGCGCAGHGSDDENQ
jgi:hypothetical protein